MTLRDQVLHVAKGGRAERIPFTCYTGLMPEGGMDIEQLATVQSAQVCRLQTPQGSITHREIEPGVRESRMETPWGVLTQLAHTETGYGSSWTKEHWIKTRDDYAVMEQWTRNTAVVPDPEPYRNTRAHLGDRGVVLVWMPRTPFQRMWIEYTGMERLALDMMDFPDAVEGLLDAMLEQSRQCLRIAAASEAELIWIPDNITGEMAGPPIFTRYLTDYYRLVCSVLLPAGKTPCCHMDGMLRQIAGCVGDTDLPVIEAFTPPPDGNFSVAEARERWPGKTLWLNFPSSVHLAKPEEVRRVTEELVAQAGAAEGFLIGVTENIPRSVGVTSLQAIAEVLR